MKQIHSYITQKTNAAWQKLQAWIAYNRRYAGISLVGNEKQISDFLQHLPKDKWHQLHSIHLIPEEPTCPLKNIGRESRLVVVESLTLPTQQDSPKPPSVNGGKKQSAAQFDC